MIVDATERQAGSGALERFAPLLRWLRWREEIRKGKTTKVPYHCDRPRRAKSTDPGTWGTRAAAEAALPQLAVAEGCRKGVGITLGDLGDGHVLFGVDLDHCRDPDSGALDPWASDIVERVGTYCEVSPSGTGVKLYGTCDAELLPELAAWPNKVARPHPAGGKDQAIECTPTRATSA
jgi:putative DNA primase/helicase